MHAQLGTQSLDSGLIAANIDPSTPAGADYYKHANGAWMAAVPIPPDRSRWGVDHIMAEENTAKLRALLEESVTARDPDAKKAGELYASFMDEARVNALGAKPLRPALARIASIRSIDGLGREMAALMQAEVRVPIAPYVNADAKQSTRYAVYLTQSGLGLPDRDYYLVDNDKFISVRAAYHKHIATMLALLGEKNPEAVADRVTRLETEIARVQWTKVDSRDAVKSYNPRTPAALAAASQGLFGSACLRALGLADDAPLIVRQPSYVDALGALTKSVPLSTWKEYLRWRLLTAYAPYLSDPFVAEDFRFKGKVLAGQPELEVRWKRGVALVDSEIGEASGRLYVARYFPPQTKARVDALVGNLIKAYGQSIDQLDWMGARAKSEAHAKLDKLHVKIGYPERWRDYSALRIVRTELVGNVQRSNRFEWRRRAAKLGGPIDRNEWGMSPPTVNAYFNPTLNEIVFPAGILQPPLYSATGSDAYNYGATGATIGHEISHGFDDQGSRYDSDGNLRDWWSDEDHRRYKEKTDRLVAQYDRYEPVPGFKVNGALTLGENIADIAGLEIAYKAYLLSLDGKPAPVIEGYTGDQLFYLGYAQSWLNKTRDERTIAQVKSDPHAPAAFRVNGVVVHMPSFYEAFGVKPGDAMYLAPELRVNLW